MAKRLMVNEVEFKRTDFKDKGSVYRTTLNNMVFRVKKGWDSEQMVEGLLWEASVYTGPSVNSGNGWVVLGKGHKTARQACKVVVQFSNSK